MINRHVSGKARGGIPSPVRKPKFSLVQTISGAGSTDTHWNFIQNGNYIYNANSGGIDVIDVSTPASASVVETIPTGFSARDMGVISADNLLVTINREGVGDDGFVKTWDITDPTNVPAVLDTYSGIETGENVRFSAVDMEGNTAYVSGRVEGGYKFTIASNGVIALANPLTLSNWETQGGKRNGSYMFFANYHHGLRIVDTATWGATTDNEVNAPILNGKTLRLWDLVISDDGDSLFATVNTSGSNSDVERGIATLDISDPTAAMGASDWVISPVGSHDTETWNGYGDKPPLGLIKWRDYIIAGNGTNGLAHWHVADTTRPTYQGRLNIQDVGDNITAVGKFTIAGIDYIIFGDGARNGSDGTDKLYICKLEM